MNEALSSENTRFWNKNSEFTAIYLGPTPAYRSLHPKVYSDIDEIMGYYERVATRELAVAAERSASPLSQQLKEGVDAACPRRIHRRGC
jgi:hypothetical protein